MSHVSPYKTIYYFKTNIDDRLIIIIINLRNITYYKKEPGWNITELNAHTKYIFHLMRSDDNDDRLIIINLRNIIYSWSQTVGNTQFVLPCIYQGS